MDFLLLIVDYYENATLVW